MGELKYMMANRTKPQNPLVALPSSGKPYMSSAAGEATLVRCPPHTLARLRQLNEAEIITLFTPVVPHSPSAALARDMDPFEPLGRALPRQVRHVPYRLDAGMTSLHGDFLPSSGSIIVVICATENVLGYDPKAFERQLKFACRMTAKVVADASLNMVPIVLLLVSNTAVRGAYEHALRDFPALVTVNDYTTGALADAVHVLFG
jgi:hypothetical protein